MCCVLWVFLIKSTAYNRTTLYFHSGTGTSDDDDDDEDEATADSDSDSESEGETGGDTDLDTRTGVRTAWQPPGGSRPSHWTGFAYCCIEGCV